MSFDQADGKAWWILLGSLPSLLMSWFAVELTASVGMGVRKSFFAQRVTEHWSRL